MKNRKLTIRFLSLALCLCMVLGLMPSVQLVADAVAAQNQTATIDTGAAVTLTDADGDGCYDIDTADKLFAFAALVNGGSPAADAELTADIVINANVLNSSGTDANSGVQYRAWTPIGSQDNQYTGTFNGAGHTISGLYGSYSEDYIGLFGYVGQGGTVENLGVIDSAVYGGSSQYGGIIAGRNDGTVRNCYAAGVITGSLAIAGMVGYNTGSITNGFVAVTARGGSMIAPLIGWNQGGTVQNCYYLSESDVGAGFGWQNGTVDSKTGHKTPAQFTSGEVAYLLGSGWGQSIGTDSRPVLGGRTVYAATYCHDGAFAGYYTNDADNTAVHNSFDANGLCAHCGKGYRNAEQNASGVYEIGNLGQLIWFAQYVNAGNKNAGAVLTADIDMSGYDWTPIASTGLYYNTTSYPDAGYTGTFDGQGHVISGLTMTASTTQEKTYGLFGTISGTVKNLGLTDVVYSFPSGTKDLRAGGVVGQMLPGSRVENCFVVDSYIVPDQYIVGGIAACNYGGTISACYTKDVFISGNVRCGNLVSDTRGDINGSDRVGTVINCWTDADRVVGTQSVLSSVTNCHGSVSDARFASGEVTYGLNGNSSTGVWKQTVGSGLPAFSGGTVYRVLGCDGKTMTYSNSSTSPKAHSFVNNICTFCGVYVDGVVVSVSKNGTVTGVYTTLNDAIQAVKDCTAADEAVITLLQDIALGDNYQEITSGVFTIDLNGHEISGTNSTWAPLYLNGVAVNVTIQGLGENSKITGNYAGIEMNNNATLTITGGTISSVIGVNAQDCTVTISGGTISGVIGVNAQDCTMTINGGSIRGEIGVYADNSTVTISGGSISGGTYGVHANNNSTVTISGGSISGDTYDIYNSESTITLTVGENGVGATFPGGITVGGTTLNGILGKAASCWQGNTMILPADDATSITGGDVVIMRADAVAAVSKSGTVTGAYATLNDAIQAVADCTADDEAVVTLIKDIALGDSYQQITSGVFTIDLNDHEISSTTKSYNGTLYIRGEGIHITIQGAGENSKITGTYAGIEMYGVTLTVISGTICGSTRGVDGGVYTLTIIGGTVSGGYYGVEAFDSTITIRGGSISGGDIGVYDTNSSTVTISGGNIRGSDCGVDVDGATMNISGGTISSDRYGVFATFSSAVTISGGNINGGNYGVYDVYSSAVTISGGNISSDNHGVYVDDGTVTISGGTISSDNLGVYVDDGTVTISGGSINGGNYGVHAFYSSTVTISGGNISGDTYDIYNPTSFSTIALTLGENGVGATFPGGITVYGTPLNEILGEGAVYWQGNTMITPADDATEITGGDVVIKAYVAPVYSGWTEIDGDWYYYDPDTGKPVTGITRVPYPTEAINGVTYAPDQESIDYAASKGQTFIDETTGLFWFDTDGKFLSSYTGIVPSEDGPSQYAVNGMIPWHVGLVQIGEDYYYFTGNTELGGNVLSTGDVYAIRNTTALNVVLGGVYTFGEDGALCKYEGITEVNGTLRYYENYRLMAGNGLTKVGQNYIYVRSNGELVVDSEYYIPENDLNIASGTYRFDENGYMIQPVSTGKDGVYFENGAWYYYESGKIACNKGLICVNTSWHGADGSENVYSGYVYVRSSGVLATGTYYITNVSNDVSGLFTTGMKVLFDENGIADAPKNGIYEIDGELYYFVGNQIQYNAGLIEYNGGWIYVRSNGKLAVGDYWITNTNGYLTQGGYEFGVDGYMIISEAEDGIVSANGVLYYYEDGKKQYGLGLRQLEDGSYIYVRTNGQLATGSYWITNHNGLLPEGLYTFGDNGIMIEN